MRAAMINFDKAADKMEERGLLLRCARVGWSPMGVESSNVSNANTMRVVPKAVCSWLRYCPATLYCPIKLNNVMISYSPPSSVNMHGLDIGSPKIFTSRGGRAVYDNIIYISGHK